MATESAIREEGIQVAEQRCVFVYGHMSHFRIDRLGSLQNAFRPAQRPELSALDIQLDDVHAARSDLAGLLASRGGVKEARAEFRRVLETNPRHRPALRGLALVQARQRDYRSAFETLQKALLLEPDHAETWLNFGDVCMFMGDRPAAREAWTKASDLKDAHEAVRTRALKRLDIYQARRSATDSQKTP